MIRRIRGFWKAGFNGTNSKCRQLIVFSSARQSLLQYRVATLPLDSYGKLWKHFASVRQTHALKAVLDMPLRFFVPHPFTPLSVPKKLFRPSDVYPSPQLLQLLRDYMARFPSAMKCSCLVVDLARLLTDTASVFAIRRIPRCRLCNFERESYCSLTLWARQLYIQT